MKIQKGSAIRDLIHTLIYADGLLLKFFEYSYVLWLIIKLLIYLSLYLQYFPTKYITHCVIFSPTYGCLDGAYTFSCLLFSTPNFVQPSFYF